MSRFLAAVLVALMVVVSGCAASKPKYPEKPVEMTVLFGAGSGADLIARQLADGMGKELKVAVPVVNRVGGGGAVGYTHVKGQQPDGYSLVWNSNSVSTAFHAGNMKFDHTAFEPVARVSIEPVVITVKAGSQFKTLKDLVAHAKANPGKVRVGNSGQGSFTHLVAVALQNAAGVQFAHVPFGRGLAVASLLGSKVEATIQLAAEVMSQIQAGQVTVVGVASDKRVGALKDAPTFKEQGYDVVLDMWRGLAVPKGTPKPVIDSLSQAAKKSVEAQGFKDFATKMAAEVSYLGPAEFGKLIAEDDKRISALMEKIGMKKSQ